MIHWGGLLTIGNLLKLKLNQACGAPGREQLGADGRKGTAAKRTAQFGWQDRDGKGLCVCYTVSACISVVFIYQNQMSPKCSNILGCVLAFGDVFQVSTKNI